MHIPQPPKGDKAETWKVDIRAFNIEFNDVYFEGYKRVDITNWIRHNMIETAEILAISRVGLEEENTEEEKSLKEILSDLIDDKIKYYQDQIEGLETLIKESEIQAQLFGDQNEYNQARQNDILKYQRRVEKLTELKDAEINIKH